MIGGAETGVGAGVVVAGDDAGASGEPEIHLERFDPVGDRDRCRAC